MVFSVLWFFLTLPFYSHVHCSDNSTIESLDVSLQALAFKTLVHHHHRTGALYKAMLPKNMSGMTASIVRIRSRRLWNRGLNISHIQIPSRTISLPYARRLAIVYEDFGNWSSQCYAVPGYSIVTSVVGFAVYDASKVEDTSIRKLHLNLWGKKPISVHFPSLTFSKGNGTMTKSRCVAFKSNGSLSLTEMSPANTCLFQDQGHFSLIVPLEEKPRHSKVWIIGLILGCFLLPVAAYMVVLFVKLMRTKKIQVMEKQADRDIVLETRWIGCSKLPLATVSRTHPNIEDGGIM